MWDYSESAVKVASKPLCSHSLIPPYPQHSLSLTEDCEIMMRVRCLSVWTSCCPETYSSYSTVNLVYDDLIHTGSYFCISAHHFYW